MNGDFRIGQWLVEPSLNTVSCDGTSHHLEPKVMAVLVCLAVFLLSRVPVYAQDQASENAVRNAAKAYQASLNKGQDISPEEAAKPKGPAVVYRLDFVLTELADGKKINSRNYSIVVRDGTFNKLRSGARYPVPTVPGGAQFTYIDLGVNIDCRADQQGDDIEVFASVDSSVLSWPDQGTEHTAKAPPVVGELKSEVRSVVHPGKPTLISSMDDPTSKRRFEVEVPATKVN